MCKIILQVNTLDAEPGSSCLIGTYAVINNKHTNTSIVSLHIY